MVRSTSRNGTSWTSRTKTRKLYERYFFFVYTDLLLFSKNNLFINWLGKELYICQTAYEEFTSIVNIVGGPNEKKRAEELFKRVYYFIKKIS